jgi:hypothetical protein
LVPIEIVKLNGGSADTTPASVVNHAQPISHHHWWFAIWHTTSAARFLLGI